MESKQPQLDPWLFQLHFRAFRKFVETQSNVPFRSFPSHPYTEEQEGYKYEVYRNGRAALTSSTWNRADIGRGNIADAVVRAIELKANNLVEWHGRFGPNSVLHRRFVLAREQPGSDDCVQIESALFDLYHGPETEPPFSRLIELIGAQYAVLAYLCFLKDRARYLPIATTRFDQAFELLGAPFKTAQHCSWTNYTTYLDLIGQLQRMLVEELGVEVSLLDAHSFAWILTSQMKREQLEPEAQVYLARPAEERAAIVMARVGQGRFRKALVDYWASCAVTGCTEAELLRASHIKPWAKADPDERVHVHNGLLLSPAIDACFDAGYISFADDGTVLISEKLGADDARCLGVHADMRLRRIDDGHRQYLAFHRENVFKRSRD